MSNTVITSSIASVSTDKLKRELEVLGYTVLSINPANPPGQTNTLVTLLGTISGAALTLAQNTVNAHTDTQNEVHRLDGSVVISGNLTVNGTTTTINSTNLEIEDNEIVLNKNFTSGTPVNNAGIRIKRGSSPDAVIEFDEANDQFAVGVAGNTQKIIRQTDVSSIDHNSLTNVGTNSHSNIDAHIASTSNPHVVTASQVGLGNLTNDAQLKRAANDFASFAAKTLPVSNDIFIIEDSAGSGVKKKLTFGDIQNALGLGGGSVSSVYGRSGAVVAQTNDYTWAQINKATSNIADIATRSHTSLTDIGVNTHIQIDNHLSSTSNPHVTTKAQVGLGSVTDDAQLKRAANDFSSFTQKLTPSPNDLVLIEDSAASGVKKYARLGDLANSGAGVPAGCILAYAGSTAPTGFLLCDGAVVSRTTYASLFTAIQTNYGVGDGSTTFGIPDLRQRFPLGKADTGTGSTIGSTGGAIDHTHTGGSHTHSIPAHYHGMGAGSTLAIGVSGSHTTALDHDHGSFNSGVGTAHSHGHTLGTNTVDINHFHGIDHDHGSVTSSAVSNDHTHNFTTGTMNSNNVHNHSFSGTTGSGNACFYRLVHNAGGGVNHNHATGYSGGVFTDITDANYPVSDHTHNYSGTTSSVDINHTHSGTTGGINSNHTHTVDLPNFGGSSGTMNVNAQHSHSITGGINNESAHTHAVDVPNYSANSASNGVHTHASSDVTGVIGLVTGGVDGNTTQTSGSGGGAATTSNNPPYLVVNYIIKT